MDGWMDGYKTKHMIKQANKMMDDWYLKDGWTN